MNKKNTLLDRLVNGIILDNLKDKFRVEFFLFFSVLAILATIITGCISILHAHNTPLAFLTFALGILVLLNVVALFWHKKYLFSVNFFLIALITMLSFMTTRFTVTNNTMGWLVAVEIVIVYLSGRKNSFFMTFLYIALLLIFYYLTPTITGQPSGIPFVVFGITLICIIFSWAFLYFYLTIYDKKDLEIEEKTKLLESTVQEQQETENTLKQVIEQGEKDNKALTDTKTAMVNVMDDLNTEKNIAEQETARDEVILESVGDGLIAVDQTGKVLIFNPIAQEILGVTTEESIGKKIFDLYQLSDEQGVVIPIEKRPVAVTLKTGEKVSQTAQIIKPDGKILIQLTSTPIKQKDVLIGAIEVVRDVTKEKEIDRMKTEFISLASHQLRTPLSAIRWFSEMLVAGDAGELTSEQKEFAQNISDSTARMIELVNSLLNISRIESGRIVIDPVPTDLKGLVDGLVKELQVKINERQQTLLVSSHEGLPEINVDPKLIRQVYLNLLTNAIKYTPKGGEIHIFISKKDDEIISQVSDNGYGIPKEQQGKIFQKFFRASNVVKVETDGTGLGMYLVKAIVDSSHGRIWFDSQEGKGTSFFFSLPLSGMEAKAGEVTLDE